jgi:hypothetical protein
LHNCRVACLGGKDGACNKEFLVTNDFSDKLVAFFVTLGGDKPEKPLKGMKETVTPKLLVGDLAVSRALEKQEDAEEQVADWCSQIQKSLN